VCVSGTCIPSQRSTVLYSPSKQKEKLLIHLNMVTGETAFYRFRVRTLDALAAGWSLEPDVRMDKNKNI
jgi:hypothetical protein